MAMVGAHLWPALWSQHRLITLLFFLDLVFPAVLSISYTPRTERLLGPRNRFASQWPLAPLWVSLAVAGLVCEAWGIRADFRPDPVPHYPAQLLPRS